jgi:hypothetical protein
MNSDYALNVTYIYRKVLDVIICNAVNAKLIFVINVQHFKILFFNMAIIIIEKVVHIIVNIQELMIYLKRNVANVKI